MTGPVLLGYDGSHDAELAIGAAVHMFDGHRAVVLSVSEPGLQRAELDVAREGAAIAQAAGLSTVTLTRTSPEPVWKVVTSVGHELDAIAIVVGVYGLGRDAHRGIRALLPGTNSAHLIQLAGRPVIVVPPPVDSARPSSGHFRHRARVRPRLRLRTRPSVLNPSAVPLL